MPRPINLHICIIVRQTVIFCSPTFTNIHCRAFTDPYLVLQLKHRLKPTQPSSTTLSYIESCCTSTPAGTDNACQSSHPIHTSPAAMLWHCMWHVFIVSMFHTEHVLYHMEQVCIFIVCMFHTEHTQQNHKSHD